MNLTELKKKSVNELLELAKTLGVEDASRLPKQQLIFLILKALSKRGDAIYSKGVLEILPDGFGFLRSASASYLAGPDDIYVSPNQIRRFNLLTGDEIEGQIRPPKDGERFFALLKVDTINSEPPEQTKNKVAFP